MTRPQTVTATRLLILALALFWLAFGLTVAVGAHPSYRDASVIRWAMAGGALCAAAILAALANQLALHRPLTYWLAVVLLGAMTLGGLLDQLGLADVIFLAINVIPLALLVRDRNWYLTPPPEAAQDRRTA